MVFACIVALKNFYFYETSTRISTVSDAFPVFPAISLCNLNILNLNFILNLTNNTNDLPDIYAMRLLFATYENITKEQRRAYGFQIEDMLYECSFNGFRCSSTDFIYFYHHYYGNCYTFNIGYFDNFITIEAAI